MDLVTSVLNFRDSPLLHPGRSAVFWRGRLASLEAATHGKQEVHPSLYHLGKGTLASISEAMVGSES